MRSARSLWAASLARFAAGNHEGINDTAMQVADVQGVPIGSWLEIYPNVIVLSVAEGELAP